MSTGTAIPSPAENIYSSMLMIPIRTKYVTATKPTEIYYIIPTNLIDASFFLQYITP